MSSNTDYWWREFFEDLITAFVTLALLCFLIWFFDLKPISDHSPRPVTQPLTMSHMLNSVHDC